MKIKMIINQDVEMLFNEVVQEISQNVRQMMEELWLNWSHVGVDHEIKVNNITKLVQFEKELHREVISETRLKVAMMQGEVDKLKEETEELSRCLAVDITVLDYKEEMMLVEYKRELEDQIVGYREQVDQRRRKMERLFEWQRDLTEKLGCTINELPVVPLPTEEDLNKLKAHLDVLQAERDKRVEIFLNTQVEIKDIMDKLQMKPQNQFEHVASTALSVDFKVTDTNMDRLARLRQDLRDKYDQVNNRVLELRERLTKLWDMLEEDHIYRDSFLRAHPGCHALAEAALRDELKRCDAIKRQKIQVFTANVRTKIKLMWDNCMYSQQQRDEFVHYYREMYTEDTLSLHEMYLDKLTMFYKEHQTIFEMVATRQRLWSKMAELEARASEPGRYHNRGGQLLKEEKERKAIASNLPKIEAQLRELAEQYETQTGQLFTVDGRPLLQLMQDEWENRKADRANKMSARKQALTPNTQLLRSLAVSPLGKRNRTAAGLPAAGDKTRPTKRQLITGSATKAMPAVASNHSALKRSAVSTVKRRVSGRLAARAVMESGSVKRKLDYAADAKRTPKLAVNGSILKHKRTSIGNSRSGGRRSHGGASAHGTGAPSAAGSDAGQGGARDPLMETTLMTTYTDFKDLINEKQISRSSLAAARPAELQIPMIMCEPIDERPPRTPQRPPATPRHASTTPRHAPTTPRHAPTTPRHAPTTPRHAPTTPRHAPMTPKVGKENVQSTNTAMTPKTNLPYTPTRLTRSALKLNEDGFATPRAPLSANKANLQRHNTNLQLKTTPATMNRSKSHTHLVRVKNLPPLI